MRSLKGGGLLAQMCQRSKFARSLGSHGATSGKSENMESISGGANTTHCRCLKECRESSSERVTAFICSSLRVLHAAACFFVLRILPDFVLGRHDFAVGIVHKCATGLRRTGQVKVVEGPLITNFHKRHPRRSKARSHTCPARWAADNTSQGLW